MTDLDLLTRLAPILFYDSAERYRAVSIDGTPDVLYARAVREGQETWLTYWAFYTDDWSPVPWRRGHPCDWEYTQFQLVGPETIGRAAYAQHASGEVRSAAAMRWTGRRPHVYVELGRHASYFVPRRWHRRRGMDFARANGAGRCVPHPVIVEPPADGWASETFGDDMHAIAAPGRTLRWRKPSTWAERL